MANEILTMRAGIAAKLRDVLDPIDVQEHFRTDLDYQDIVRVLGALRAKIALRVSFMGIVAADEVSYEADAMTAWAVYIAAQDIPKNAAKPAVSRDVAILSILPTVVRVIAGDGFAPSITSRRPVNVRVRELEAGEAESTVASAAIWAVEWQQLVCFTPDEPDDLRPFLQSVFEYDLAPKDGVIDADDTIEQPQDP